MLFRVRGGDRVVSPATNPELAGDEAARVRERLARAGLLASDSVLAPPRPARDRVRRARERAGKGRPLSEIVGEGRR